MRLFIILFLLLPVMLSAQAYSPKTADSLKAEVSRTRDPEDQALLLLKLSDYTLPVQPQQSIDYARQALRIGTQEKSKVLVATAGVTLVRCFIAVHYEDSAAYYVRETEKPVKNLRLPDLRISWLQVRAELLELEEKWQEAQKAYVDLANECDKVYEDPSYEAAAYEKAGFAANKAGSRQTALKFFKQALDLTEKEGKKQAAANSYFNIGLLFAQQQEYKNAEDNFDKAAQLYKKAGDIRGEAKALANLGMVLMQQGNDKKAQKNLERSVELAAQAGDQPVLALAQNNMGRVLLARKDYENARQTLIQANATSQSAKDDLLYAIGMVYLGEVSMYENKFDETRSEVAVGIKIARNNRYIDVEKEAYRVLSEMYEKEGRTDSSLLYYRRFSLLRDSILVLEKNARLQDMRSMMETERIEKENQLLKQENILNNALLERQKLVEQSIRLQAEQEKQKSELLVKENTLSELRFEAEMAEKKRVENENELLKKDREIQEQKLIRRNMLLLVLLVGTLFLVTLLIVIYSGYSSKKRNNRLLKEKNSIISQRNSEVMAQKSEIEKEQQKSEELLLNILPLRIAQELKENGVATPHLYENVSVLFTDFVGFTKTAEKLSPEEVIYYLDQCFLGFDEICEKYRLEKIKTVGDAYMAACGVPVPHERHAVNTVHAGMEITVFMEKFNQTLEAASGVRWPVRVGIHSGPVVAGVIGKRKFAFDIWGDTVNIAARMEQSGEAGRVNISGATYEIVKYYFECTPRGKVYAKNKGDVDMYFVDRLLRG